MTVKELFAAALLAGFLLPGGAAVRCPADDAAVQRCRNWTLTARVTDDRIVYPAGEPVEFVFDVKDENGDLVKTDYLLVRTKIDGQGEETREYVPLAQANPFRRTLTLEKPGQIQLDATVCNPSNVNRKIKQHHEFYRQDEKGSLRPLSAGSGVLFDLRKIRPGAPEPADFDRFWQEQIAADKALPFKVIEKRLVRTTEQNVRVYSLVLNALVGTIHAEMSIPAKAEDDPSVKLPIWVIGQAYGVASFSTWPWDHYITIAVNSHDIENYRDRDYYKNLHHGKLKDYGFARKDKTNDDPKSAYFYGMIMRDYRAVRYLTETMPQWNGEIRFYGRSQGGYRAVILAGLFPETVSVEAGVPWSTDLGGVLAGRPKLWRPDYTPALRYLDPVYHARRIKNAHVTVEAGLIDVACQAAGITALFNNLPASNPSRTLRLYQHTGHSIPTRAKGHFRYELKIRDGAEEARVIQPESAETCVFRHPLTSEPKGFVYYKHDFRHPGKAAFTEDGIVFADDGKRTRASTTALLDFPGEFAAPLRAGEVVVSLDMKVEGFEDDLKVGWILKGAKFTQWTGTLTVPADARGWNTYTFAPWHQAWPDLERFILNLPIPKKGRVAIRNMVIRRKYSNLNLAPFFNTGYQVDQKTPEGRKNCFGDAARDMRKFTFAPWTTFANVPLKPVCHDRKNILAKQMVRFSNDEKFPGVKEITVPVADKDFSARKLYLLHALHRGGDDFRGTVAVKGRSGAASFDVKFGRDIRNLDDPDNKANAFKGAVFPANWGREIQNIVVSAFDIPPHVGAVETVTFNADPGKGIYFLFAAHLSNFAYEIDRRGMKVIRRSDEWVPFPFPKKSGVLPGSVLDTGAKTPEAVGAHGRLVSTPDGELVAEKRRDRPYRFRMQGTGAAEYSAPLPKNYEKIVERLKKDGELFFTDFVFAPYCEDVKKNMENIARLLAMQNYNMIRVCGLHHFTAELGLDFTEREMDYFFYLVKCFREKGIYIHLDIGHAFCKGRAWTNENAEERHLARIGINFDERERARLKKGMTKVLTTVNPYTGLALKDDPVIVFINGWNENHLEFRRYADPAATARFSAFLSSRYADMAVLRKAWGSDADAAWRRFEDVPVDFTWCRVKKASARKKDIWDFYVGCAIERLNWFKVTLREIGYTGMISDYNFGQALEGIRSRMDGDYVVMNRYHEHPLTEWIRNQSPIETKDDLIRALASIQFLDRPYVITETGVCFWNNYRYEQPFILDAYAALNGIDVLTNFAGIIPNRGGTFQRKGTPRITTFFGVFDPIMFASEFLGVHFFNLGKVRTAATKVRVELDRDEIADAQEFNYGLGNDQTILALVCRFGVEWKDRKRPVRADEMVLPRISRTGIVREEKFAYTVDDKSKTFNADACVAEMKKRGLIPAANRTSVKDGIFESVTGELYMDTKKKFGAVNTPQAQGIFALAGTTYKLPQFEIREMTVNGMLNVVSSDGRDIAASERLTIVHATNALNEGLTLRDDDMKVRIINGEGPVLYQTGRFTVTLKNKNASKLKAYVVRLDGSRDGELPVTVNGDELTLAVDTAKIPGGPAIFFELALK